MAKRFTDTDKWKKKFIRSLPAPYKLLWLYLLDECDHSGVWIVDFDVARLRLDENVDEMEALNLFEDKILPIDNGERWLILDFIEFQYGILKAENRAHQAVINTLIKYQLWDDEEETIIKNKVLERSFKGPKDKEKEKEKDKDKEKEKEKEGENQIFYPFNSDEFLSMWKVWLDYRKEIKKPYKSKKSEQAALKQLSEFDESFAINLIERSIAGGYQGLVFDNTKAEYLKNGQGKQTLEQFGNEIDEHFNAKYSQGAT